VPPPPPHTCASFRMSVANRMSAGATPRFRPISR
jgi:hypothetical protein